VSALEVSSQYLMRFDLVTERVISFVDNEPIASVLVYVHTKVENTVYQASNAPEKQNWVNGKPTVGLSLDGLSKESRFTKALS